MADIDRMGQKVSSPLLRCQCQPDSPHALARYLSPQVLKVYGDDKTLITIYVLSHSVYMHASLERGCRPDNCKAIGDHGDLARGFSGWC